MVSGEAEAAPIECELQYSLAVARQPAGYLDEFPGPLQVGSGQPASLPGWPAYVGRAARRSRSYAAQSPGATQARCAVSISAEFT